MLVHHSLPPQLDIPALYAHLSRGRAGVLLETGEGKNSPDAQTLLAFGVWKQHTGEALLKIIGDQKNAPDGLFVALPYGLYSAYEPGVTAASLQGEAGFAMHPEAVYRIHHTTNTMTSTEPFDADSLSSLGVVQPVNVPEAVDIQTFETDLSQDAFLAAVATIRENILAGEVFQSVLSVAFSCARPSASPLELYAALRHMEPTTHLVYMDLGDDHHVLSASPEILFQTSDEKVRVSPIAGTRYRHAVGRTSAEIEQELVESEKENAEHDMLLDLGRNDLGGICTPGSIYIPEGRKKYIKRYAHVVHLVSDVVGELNADVSPVDVLKAVHPAGTLVGAPKVRAANLVASLEGAPRGLYGGALGYITPSGNAQLTIAIRTLELTKERAQFRCGAGVVADSVPEHEWKEILNKGKTLAKLLSSSQKQGRTSVEHVMGNKGKTLAKLLSASTVEHVSPMNP